MAVAGKAAADGWGLDMDLEQMSSLFRAMEWKWDLGDDYTHPSPFQIGQMIWFLIQTLKHSDEKIAFNNMGRLMVYSDPDFPSFWSVAIEVGIISKEHLGKEVH